MKFRTHFMVVGHGDVSEKARTHLRNLKRVFKGLNEASHGNIIGIHVLTSFNALKDVDFRRRRDEDSKKAAEALDALREFVESVRVRIVNSRQTPGVSGLCAKGSGRQGRSMSQKAIQNLLSDQLKLPRSSGTYDPATAVPCPFCSDDLLTGVPCFSAAERDGFNKLRSERHAQNLAANPKARRTMSNGTSYLPLIFQCRKNQMHCLGDPQGRGCPLCENGGAQELVPDPMRNGNLICNAACCVQNCNKYWEHGKEQSIIVSRVLQDEKESTPTKTFSLAQVLGETFTAQAKAQQIRHSGAVVDISQLNEDAGKSFMNQPFSRDELFQLGSDLGPTSTTLRTGAGDFNMRQPTGKTRYDHNSLDQSLRQSQLPSSSGSSHATLGGQGLRLGTGPEADLAQALQNSKHDIGRTGCPNDEEGDLEFAQAIQYSEHDQAIQNSEHDQAIQNSKHDSKSSHHSDSSSFAASTESITIDHPGDKKKRAAAVIESCEEAIGTQINVQYPDESEQKIRKKEFRRNVKNSLMTGLYQKDEHTRIVHDAIENAASVTPPVKKLSHLVAGANALNAMNSNNSHSPVFADDILSPN